MVIIEVKRNYFLILQPTNPSLFGQLCCQLKILIWRHLVKSNKITKEKKKENVVFGK